MVCTMSQIVQKCKLLRIIINKFMGNNLGLQIQDNQIKLAYLAASKSDVEVIDGIKSQYLQKRLEMKNGQVLFFGKFTLQQFNHLRESKKVRTLQEHYNSVLKPNIEIFMNTETEINIQANMSIKQTIKLLIKGEFTPKSRHSMESSVKFLSLISSLGIQETFFHFNSQFKANELHLITKQLAFEKVYRKLPPYPYILANLRKGSSIYLVHTDQNIQKIAGSIIGELTIQNIIRAMNNWQEFDIDQILQKTFQFGDNKKADLLVEDIYGKVFTGLGIDGNIIASSLGKVGHGGQASFQDKCKSLILAFGINIGMVIQLQMKLQNINDCVLLANKFHNEYFYFVVQSIVKFFHPQGSMLFAELGNYMGCLGNIDLQQI